MLKLDNDELIKQDPILQARLGLKDQFRSTENIHSPPKKLFLQTNSANGQ